MKQPHHFASWERYCEYMRDKRMKKKAISHHSAGTSQFLTVGEPPKQFMLVHPAAIVSDVDPNDGASVTIDDLSSEARMRAVQAAVVQYRSPSGEVHTIKSRYGVDEEDEPIVGRSARKGPRVITLTTKEWRFLRNGLAFLRHDSLNQGDEIEASQWKEILDKVEDSRCV